MITTIDLKFLGQSNVIAAFLVHTDDGPVLVETGPNSAYPQLLAGIEKAGFSASDIRHVLLTHIHLDHAGSAWCFAEQGATIYVHPYGIRHLANPERLMASARQIYQDDMERLWGEMRPIKDRFLLACDHKERFKIGRMNFRSLHTPGHAVHHLAWELGDVLFTGDVAGVKIGESSIVVPPCPPPDIDVEDWVASISMIKLRRYKSLYLTHFGQVTNVKNHLIELEGRLLNWANWIKPFWENGTEKEELIPLFQKFVEIQLTSAGVTGEDFSRYEKANPAWMNVAGLMRYWEKRRVS